jgi:hypothetical protein
MLKIADFPALWKPTQDAETGSVTLYPTEDTACLVYFDPDADQWSIDFHKGQTISEETYVDGVRLDECVDSCDLDSPENVARAVIGKIQAKSRANLERNLLSVDLSVSKVEFDTILAALRFYAQHLRGNLHHVETVRDIASDSGEMLGANGVDKLADRINE